MKWVLVVVCDRWRGREKGMLVGRVGFLRNVRGLGVAATIE